MFVNAVYVWNHLQSCHQNVILHMLRANKLKERLITFSLKGLTERTSACAYRLFILQKINFLEAYLGLFPTFWPC